MMDSSKTEIVMYYFLLYLLSVISELKNLLDTIAGTSMMLLIFYCVGLFVYWSIQHEKRSDDILDGIEKKYRIVIPEEALPKFTDLNSTVSIVEEILKKL